MFKYCGERAAGVSLLGGRGALHPPASHTAPVEIPGFTPSLYPPLRRKPTLPGLCQGEEGDPSGPSVPLPNPRVHPGMDKHSAPHSLKHRKPLPGALAQPESPTSATVLPREGYGPERRDKAAPGPKSPLWPEPPPDRYRLKVRPEEEAVGQMEDPPFTESFDANATTHEKAQRGILAISFPP